MDLKNVSTMHCLTGDLHRRWLCFTNPVRDSSRASSVMAGVDEQTEHTDLQNPELARV